MTARQPFFPHYGTNQVIPIAAGATVTKSIVLTDDQLRVINNGSNKFYFRTYNSQNLPVPVATVADCVMPAGLASIVTCVGHDSISLFAAAVANAEIMTGEGF